jgi:hypothetical protein
VCYVAHKTTSELEHVTLIILLFVGVENTGNWHARKGDL